MHPLELTLTSCQVQVKTFQHGLCSSCGYDIAMVYSQTSDSGPSEIGTQYNKALYKGHFSRSQIIGLPMVLIHFEPPRRGQPLYKT